MKRDGNEYIQEIITGANKNEGYEQVPNVVLYDADIIADFKAHISSSSPHPVTSGLDKTYGLGPALTTLFRSVQVLKSI